MIKSKSGQELRIVKGSKKCITGIKPFLVEANYSQEQIMQKILNPARPLYLKRFYLRKDEMIYDNEAELYEAIGYKLDNQ